MIGLLGRTRRRHAALTFVAFCAASVSGVAILLHAAGWLPMYFLVDSLALPSLVLLLALGVIARRIVAPLFFARLVTGAWASLAATAAYDVVRLVLWKGGVFHFNPFMTHPIFGRLITGLPETTATAIAVGWAYHVWNGFGFGVMYTLVAGASRWWYALVWSAFLEAAWLTALPSTLHFKLRPEFVALSVIGHGAYGITLGMLSQRRLWDGENGPNAAPAPGGD